MKRRLLEKALWPGLALMVVSGVALLGLQAYEALIGRTAMTALARTWFAVLLIVFGHGLVN
jgi:hypothetical protein